MDRPFSGTARTLTPAEHRQAQVDGGGVEGVDGLLEVEAEVLVGVERAGPGDQAEGKLFADVPGAPLVGAGEGRQAGLAALSGRGCTNPVTGNRWQDDQAGRQGWTDVSD